MSRGNFNGMWRTFKVRNMNKGKGETSIESISKTGNMQMSFWLKLQEFYLRKSLSFSLEEGSYIRFIP